jgi:hypothetical protein
LLGWLIDWCTFVSCRWTHNRFARVGGTLWFSERWMKPVSMSTPPPPQEPSENIVLTFPGCARLSFWYGKY